MTQSPQEVARKLLDGLTLHSDKEMCSVDAGDIRTLCNAVLAGQKAVEDERERCISIVDQFPHWIGVNAKREIVSAIRNGSTPTHNHTRG